MKIKKIESIEVDNEEVYDMTVPIYHNFLTGAGIFVHNCAQLIYSAFTTPIHVSINDIASSVNQYHQSSITTQVKPMYFNTGRKPMSDRDAMKKALAMFNR